MKKHLDPIAEEVEDAMMEWRFRNEDQCHEFQYEDEYHSSKGSIEPKPLVLDMFILAQKGCHKKTFFTEFSSCLDMKVGTDEAVSALNGSTDNADALIHSKEDGTKSDIETDSRSSNWELISQSDDDMSSVFSDFSIIEGSEDKIIVGNSVL